MAEGSDADEQNIIEMTNRLNNQEMRVYQRKLDELREQYESAKVSAMSANESLRLERVRLKAQEKDNERLKKLVDESNETVRKLRHDLDEAKKAANANQWETREKELRACFETESIQHRAKITGLEAMLKRRQQELDHLYQMSKSAEESMQHEINQLKHALEKSQADLNRHLEESKSQKREKESDRIKELEYHENLQRQIGALNTKNEVLHSEKDRLESDVARLNEVLHSTKSEILRLQKQLVDKEDDNIRHDLYKQLEDVKSQRAQIRCDLLHLKKEHQRLLNERNTSEGANKSILEAKESKIQSLANEVEELHERLKSIESEKNMLSSENDELKKAAAEAHKKLNDIEKELSDKERSLKENEASENARIALLTQELETSNKKIDNLKIAIKTLDEHSETLMRQIKTMDTKKKRAEEQVSRLNLEIDELRSKADANLLMEENCSKLTEENKRLTNRIEYLETELRETHTDHREELAKLAKQLTLSKNSASQSVNRETMARIQHLESEMRQKDSQLRSYERQVDQAKADARNLEKEICSLRDEQIKVVNENTQLRQGLADAIKKIQDRDKTIEELKEAQDSLKEELSKMNSRWAEIDDQNQQIKEEIAHKEKLVAYLQSQIQPKQIPKMKYSATRCSTLLASGSESFSSTDVENEARQCEELEAQRDRLRSTLEHQKKVLAERQKIEAVPLLKDSPTKAIQATNDETWSSHDDITKNRMGIMRHEIPHRWTRKFISLIGAKCAICLEGVPRFRHAMKCRECNIIVHRNCLPRVSNTCGLPVACADYYLDSHMTQIGVMNGWVKLLRSDEIGANRWRNAWATIDGNQLKFSDTDNLSEGRFLKDGHFLAIDLVHEQWKIYNQTGEISGIQRENLSMLIELKLPSYTLYMLCPTQQSKQRWVQALQAATNRRMQRRHTTTHPAGNTLLLALDKPQNLGIHCTTLLDDWLLIGAEEGLFVTNYFSPSRSPFNIAGIPSTVYHLELIPEFEMLIAICGKFRSLVAIHVQQLRLAINDSNRAGVSFTPITHVDNCHLAIVSKPEHNEQRYIYMATIDSIHVLQYVRKRDMFAQVATIRTEEPCMCITSVPNGLVFGSDTFYFASAMDNSFRPIPLQIDNCPPDFPVAVVTISSFEILVVYHNFGVFVDPNNGQRTRKDNLEWERAPLEFVYAAPYLYIAYCEFLEIVQVAPHEGEHSKTITEERDVYRCRSAHHTGFGANSNEVVFAVSGTNRVELHVFNALGHSRSGSLKRKLNETISNLHHPKRKV